MAKQHFRCPKCLMPTFHEGDVGCAFICAACGTEILPVLNEQVVFPKAQRIEGALTGHYEALTNKEWQEEIILAATRKKQ